MDVAYNVHIQQEDDCSVITLVFFKDLVEQLPCSSASFSETNDITWYLVNNPNVCFLVIMAFFMLQISWYIIVKKMIN